MPAPRPPIVATEPVFVEILVEAGAWQSQTELKAIAAKVVDATIEAARPRLAKDAELSIVFADDAHIQRLNRQFRNVDGATNVLSFPGGLAKNGQFGPLLGDVVFAYETIFNEAEAQDLTMAAHLSHLIVHGVLHLLGYDHVDEAEARTMERLETRILGYLGIADPYREPARETQ